ncbi:hypothetical protein GCM10023194_01710 [Planotetraspora phitsanulokensis]|uniref:Uncharacterized protein n=2 Tax=Planotetraspora phitsanulokensis TaxID=575192 RepID=A0A8J3XGK4_9ACTN|nr:hypothetical protein Pph01_52070 [Planotetraspora phitsanulokensis]
MQSVARILVPSRLRRTARDRIDARYVTKPEHRQDIRNAREDARKDIRKSREDIRKSQEDIRNLRQEVQALRQEAETERRRQDAEAQQAQQEIQALRRDLVALRDEVNRLRQMTTTVNKANDVAVRGQRLAEQTAEALDHVLQNEVRVWQAIDGLSAQTAVTEISR